MTILILCVSVAAFKGVNFLLQSLILGIVQGITEFLPISSSAHLILIPLIFKVNDGVTSSLFFDVALHLGTFLSIMFFFYKDWVKLIKGFFSSLGKHKAETHEEKLIWYIIFATIPAVIAGAVFENTIDKFFHTGEFGSIIYITIPLTIVSFLMIFCENNSTKEKVTADITLKDSLIIGFAQALALFPGVSRSGITICSGLLLGYKREESAKFSFLLSTPVIFGAFLLSFVKSVNTLHANDIGFSIIGAVSSAIVGYLAIKYLLKFLVNRRLNIFAYYRIALAILLAIIFFNQLPRSKSCEVCNCSPPLRGGERATCCEGVGDFFFSPPP